MVLKIPIGGKWLFALLLVLVTGFATLGYSVTPASADGDAVPDGVTINGIIAVAEEDLLNSQGQAIDVTVFGGVTGPWTPCDHGCPTQRIAWRYYPNLQAACDAAAKQLADRQAAANRGDSHYRNVPASGFHLITQCGGAPAPTADWWAPVPDKSPYVNCVYGVWGVLETDQWAQDAYGTWYVSWMYVEGHWFDSLCVVDHPNDNSGKQYVGWYYSSERFMLANVCVAVNNRRYPHQAWQSWDWAFQHGGVSYSPGTVRC